MAEQDQNFSVWSFVKGFGKLVIGFLLVLQGIVGLLVMLFVVGLIISVSSGIAGDADGPTVTVPKDVALWIDPEGVLVEQAEEADPLAFVQNAYLGSEPAQIEVHDLVRAIRKAKDDERIKGLVLDLGDLFIPTSYASKVHYLADEIDAFKESGKPVYAIGDYYSQEHYLLASRADKVLLHDRGAMFILGYGRYGAYYKSLLENALVTPHVFRVGTFKSAVEPIIRDDMSEEAKEANREYLGALWTDYAASIEAAREMPSGSIDAFVNGFNDRLRDANGDLARAALDGGFVDELASQAKQVEALKQAFGADKSGQSFKNVRFGRYLASLGGVVDDADPDVAIVTVAGTIVEGEAPAGVAAGGDTIAKLLRKAREDEEVKAVVLRVDSPGGSAFASAVISDEVKALRDAGKPVVASMGSLAASGGYWVSAGADEIWAAPTTITGSIGIFGVLFTYEDLAARVGVNVDGVGTTALTSIYGAGLGPLEDNIADILQQSIEHGYQDFLSVVASGRGLDRDYVDSIGQGRVWIGDKATELRLVDNIGSIDDAVEAAARLANLEKYDRIEMIEELTPFERLVASIGVDAMERFGLTRRAGGPGEELIAKWTAEAARAAERLGEFNDPNAAYARCLACAE